MFFEVIMMDVDYQIIKKVRGIKAEQVAEEIIQSYSSDIVDERGRTNTREFVKNVCEMKKNVSWGMEFGEVAILPLRKVTK
jgi:hypothetical protein